MSTPTHNALLETETFLLPYMDVNRREAWLTEAIRWRDEALFHHIDFSGAAKPFTTRCLQLLWDHGILEGDLAINHLLLTLKPHVGKDRQQRIDQLTDQLRALYTDMKGKTNMKSSLRQRNIDRLQALDELLELASEKQTHYEKELLITASAEQKFELRQRIKKEVIPNLRKYEQEYADLLAELANDTSIADSVTESLVEEAIAASRQLQAQHPSLPEPLQTQLTTLLEQLQAPDKSATAKLKITLPVIPLLAAYELELDTENFLNQAWRKIKTFFRSAVDTTV